MISVRPKIGSLIRRTYFNCGTTGFREIAAGLRIRGTFNMRTIMALINSGL